MAAALHHRGPDDEGIVTRDNVGLVATRLAIVDPGPAGHQPMEDARGSLLLAYNGEAFNHLELRGALPHRSFRGGSDTETILIALDEWGEDAVPRLNGLFAFAALDAKARRLLLVRDRFGVKPLYVCAHGGAVWFASEINALFAAGIPRRPRADRVARALTVGWAQGPETLIDGIEGRPAGSVLEVGLDNLARREVRWFEAPALVSAGRQAELEERPR